MADAHGNSIGASAMKVRKRTLRRWSIITLGGLIFLMALSHMGAKMLHDGPITPQRPSDAKLVCRINGLDNRPVSAIIIHPAGRCVVGGRGRR